MGTQLRLISTPRRPARTVPLDARTRRIGREGIARARRILAEVGGPHPAPRHHDHGEFRRAG